MGRESRGENCEKNRRDNIANMKAKEKYRLQRLAKIVAGSCRVLDLGFADMPNRYLQAEELVGFDLVKKAGVSDNYTDFVTGDVMDLPEPFGEGSFDAVVAGELIEHMERPLDFLRGCCDVLDPGGIIVLSTPNPNSPIERLLTIGLSRKFFYTEDHVMLYPQRWLIRILEIAGFEDVQLYSGGLPVPFFGLVPFPRPWCYQTIATGKKKG